MKLLVDIIRVQTGGFVDMIMMIVYIKMNDRLQFLTRHLAEACPETLPIDYYACFSLGQYSEKCMELLYVIGYAYSVAIAAMRWESTGWNFCSLRLKWIRNQSRTSRTTDMSSDWPGLSDCENKEHRFRALLDIEYGVYHDLW